MPRTPHALFVTLAALLLTLSPAPAQPPKPGDTPPPLTLEDLLQTPAGTPAAPDLTLESLRGNVVVLEFWATWCGPCVAAIPHLNDLADHYKDKPVRFISITDEPRDKIEAFLAKKPMKSWVALDTNKSTIRAYGVRGIPHTVVIDRSGKVAAITHPTHLTARVIDDVLAGKDPGLPFDDGSNALGPDSNLVRPLAEFSIRPSTGDHGGYSTSDTELTFKGQTALTIIAAACATTPTRILPAPDALPGGAFDVVAIVPPGAGATLRPRLVDTIELALGLTIREEPRETDVYLLTAPDGPGKGLTPTASEDGSSSSWSGTSINAVNIRSADLATSLEHYLKRPVLDESGLKDPYDLTFRFADDTPATIIAAARAQLGIELTPAKRTITVFVVERAKVEHANSPTSP